MKQTDKDLFIGLLTKSFNFMDKRVEGDIERTHSLDLIRAIWSYRDFPDKNQFLIEYPNLIDQKDYIDLLWKHFKGLSPEALSDLVIEMIHDIYES